MKDHGDISKPGKMLTMIFKKGDKYRLLDIGRGGGGCREGSELGVGMCFSLSDYL